MPRLWYTYMQVLRYIGQNAHHYKLGNAQSQCAERQRRQTLLHT